MWRISADGGESRRLTSGQFWRATPTWSPDGSRIVFSREERPGGLPDLYAIPAEGGPPSSSPTIRPSTRTRAGRLSE